MSKRKHASARPLTNMADDAIVKAYQFTPEDRLLWETGHVQPQVGLGTAFAFCCVIRLEADILKARHYGWFGEGQKKPRTDEPEPVKSQWTISDSADRVEVAVVAVRRRRSELLSTEYVQKHTPLSTPLYQGRSLGGGADED